MEENALQMLGIPGSRVNALLDMQENDARLKVQLQYSMYYMVIA
jgi:hypothetical protein